MSDAATPAQTPQAPNATSTALKVWVQAYRVELTLFAVAFFALMMFSGQRFLRQSAAPHFVYQAKAWLEGRQDIAADVLPNFEDWACVREVNGVKERCRQPLGPDDRWYSSFPMFPSAVMLPFVAVHGYQLNDTSFGVFIGALAIALFYSLLRLLSEHEGTGRGELENAALAVVLGFGTLFFYAALRGEVWFSAEVMGVALTCLYLRNAVGARRPLLAGLFWAMAVLTRTPLVFTGVFFVIEAIAPTAGQRREQLKAFFAKPGEVLKTKLQPFAVGAAPLAVIAMVMNQTRFGSIAEFGHRFFFENRVNADIDRFGLFHPIYLARNLEAAFLLLPNPTNPQEPFSFWGMTMLLTTPLLVLAATKGQQVKAALASVAAMLVTLVLAGAGRAPNPQLANVNVAPGEAGLFGLHPAMVKVILVVTLGGAAVAYAIRALSDRDRPAPRLFVPLWLTVAATALPGLLYQNTGYAQFGFRFSLDYTPYLVVLVAVSGWRLLSPIPLVTLGLGALVNFWGALAFRGYTELVRRW
ncbi:MAG: cell envelope integrity protein CreD [Myxococcaceae bacterium]|nr:cell envelope integrity protein CreD [Myxococcaceae bacterium]